MPLMVAAATRYRHLSELAIDFLERTGCPQSPQALAARLLGPAGQPAGDALPGGPAEPPGKRSGSWSPMAPLPFVRLVEELLGTDDRFARDSTGSWGLAAWERERRAPTADIALADVDFAVVDVETTGGRTEQHRMIEVAVVTVQRGEITGRYESLVNASHAVPAFITARTGITQEMVEGAPDGAEVLPEVRAMIGERRLVGHNIGRALGVLNYEALWHDLQPFGNPTLDTEELALRLLPELRRPSLGRVAAALGLATPLRDRALAGARLTAQVLRTLLGRLPAPPGETSGAIGTWGQLQGWLAGEPAGRQQRLHHARSGPSRAGPSRAGPPAGTLQALPAVPGVYTFRDAAGQVLYVGKAASLRERVAQHFSGTARALRRQDGLLDRTTDVVHEVTGCELDALLLESARIKSLKPPYNVQARSRQSCPFVRLESGPFPRASATQQLAGPALYAGPYRTSQQARHVVDALRRVFQLRSCRRILPAARPEMRRPCLRLGQGLCPAPCADQVTPEQYAVLVQYAWRFVTRGRAAALDALDQRIAELDQIAGDGDGVAWERRMLWECRARLRRVRREYRPVEGGIAGEDLVMAYRASHGGGVLFFVRDGRLLRRLDVAPGDLQQRDGEALTALLEARADDRPDPPHPPLDADQEAILLRWIYRHSGHPECVPAPAHTPTAEIARAVALALA